MQGAEPDIAFAGLSVWVLGRTFPDAASSWDGDLLTVRLLMETPGARVEVTERCVPLSAFVQFADALAALAHTLHGIARFEPLEPAFRLEFAGDGKGHIAVTVDLTPDHLTQRHRFEIAIDQTFLGPILAGCRKILDAYPPRDGP